MLKSEKAGDIQPRRDPRGRFRARLHAGLGGALFLASTLLAAALPAPGRAADATVIATGLRFPEGVIFVGGTLYFADYALSSVLRIVGGKVEQVWHQDGCGANGLVELHGELLVACYENGTVVRITRDGQLRETISRDAVGGGFVAPNDLAADAAGGVYFSASGNGAVPGRIYYRDPAGAVRMVADGIRYANGLAVSGDGKRLYVAESEAHRLLTYAIGAEGALSAKTELVRLADILADGRHDSFTPDGLRLDRHGRLYVGLYDGGGFAVLTGDGKLVRKVDLPAAHHASLAITPDGRSVVVTATDDTAGGGYDGALVELDNPVPE